MNVSSLGLSGPAAQLMIQAVAAQRAASPAAAKAVAAAAATAAAADGSFDVTV